MAQIPARITGDYELLLTRLESGTAESGDQQWAAEILRASRVPTKASGQKIREADRRRFIYLDVLAELQRRPQSLEAAFEAVALKHRTSRQYDDGSDRDDLSRQLSAKRVAACFYQERAASEAAEAWWEEHRHDYE